MKNNKGYHIVDIGSKKGMTIHRLVAIHYIPNPNNLPQVDHINRIKTNNDVSNLRWVSNSDNQQNVGIRITNTSGHKNISYCISRNRWVYTKRYYGKFVIKRFKSKSDALCYKYIMCLRIKAGHVKKLRNP